MGIVITTNAHGMCIVNCYSIVLYGDHVQEICRAGRDGKDSVAMVQYISYACNLRTGEPEVKAVVTSKYQTRPTNLLTYVQANIVVVIVLLTARKSLQFKQIRNG